MGNSAGCQDGDCNCRDVYDKINALLDCDCNKEQQEEYIRAINNCPHCLEKYNIEKAFKDFVSLKGKCKEMPEGLVDRIRSQMKKSGR